MVFSSIVFIFLFFPLVLTGYLVIPKKHIQWKNFYLFLASSLFYFWGEQKIILLMYTTILLNYGAGLLLTKKTPERKLKENSGRTKFQKVVFYTTMLLTIGSLSYYKYLNFGIDSFNTILSLLNIPHNAYSIATIALPLGISFYTFHILSYTIDVYTGKLQAEHNILRLATYIMMFPQLIAGPIVRYIDVYKQFYNRSITRTGFSNGIRRFMIGLAKKVLIANTVAQPADIIFALPSSEMSISLAWLGAICYTLQIYFDFSGYSDMALGIGQMFGFKYKENFLYPYIAQSIGEFWRRWHISLTSWLIDYVYIPLGGSKSGKLKTYRNLLLVFLLSGLWHGANFTIILWGAWQGIFVILEKMWLKKILSRMWRPLRHFYVILVVILSFVVFRADTITKAIEYLTTMFGIGNFGANSRDILEFLQKDVVLAILFGIITSCNLAYFYHKWILKIVIHSKHPEIIFAGYKMLSFIIASSLFVLAVMSLSSNTYNPFIYFRF